MRKLTHAAAVEENRPAMKPTIHSIHFDADKKLIDLINKKVDKLDQFNNRLIDAGLLTDGELAWINDYHAWVYEVLSPNLAGDELGWLESATSRITR